ncbi:Isopentenyl-diphosphate Delta-isomerase [Corynebacterium occultum]|uniref:Isopentenyl-diphosphate Delta-isomerase n=1 Tax=Corynebacterium occultum TaxID=2675219 RepID=A0A6B8VY18_9CORY|nr:isopentenyl-diphosphate Delta-isomerase [Corynebacterium occultum]QGU07939.1 Isopentenyl-diphosphate Delta-isomerase [Corynebacterium occultum]
MNQDVELVVLADENGNPAGTALKATIHTADTPLHFAFSNYLLDDRGRVLMTRRALSKITWPGVWTNSFCGHPGPGESNEDAVRRRAVTEVGLPAESILEITAILPEFQYRAVDSTGIVEWEICPVHISRLAPGHRPEPNPEEIDSFDWIEPAELFAAVDAAPFAFSSWLVEQLSDQNLRLALTEASANLATEELS